MESLLVKHFASNFLRVRTIASSSRFFSTKGYEFALHDTKHECILKCDDRLGSSAAHGVINDAFSPYVSPTENLSRLLNFSDLRIGYVHGTHVFPRWSVVEDDKALYILRDSTAKDIEDVREFVKEFVTENHEGNFTGPGPISEEEYISGNVKENFEQYDPFLPIIDSMRGDEYAHTGEYGGYAMEICLDNSLYSVLDMKLNSTRLNRKLYIPKKKVEGTKSIGGKLIFFQEKKFFKPTPWRPT